MVACTVYKTPMAEWSKLSFSSPELLAHAASNPVDGSILYTQIRNYPTPLLYHVYWQLPLPRKEVLYNQRRLGFVAL